MTVAEADLSRAVSHALRHEPWLYELELDEEGWTPVEQLLAALQRMGGQWNAINGVDLDRMLATATKRRHELDGERIRALYGHSLPGRIQKRPAIPPARLFHGTAPAARTVITVDGLLPMGRQFVHLSVDPEMAEAVGRRNSASPVVLAVDAAAASSAGIRFYAGNERVWLADGVPPRYIDVLVRQAVCPTQRSWWRRAHSMRVRMLARSSDRVGKRCEM